jgi:hypothetical protein
MIYKKALTLAKEKNLNENYKSERINTKYYFETIKGIF